MWRKKWNKYSDERTSNVVRYSPAVQTCVSCKKIVYVVHVQVENCNLMIILIISSRLVMLLWVSSINQPGLFRFWEWELITLRFWGCLLCYWQLDGRECVITQVKINLTINCQISEIICSFQKICSFLSFSKMKKFYLNCHSPGQQLKFC